MKGGTRKRGASWSYYFDMGKVDGKRRKKEKGGFATKKEAEAALAKAMNEYNNAGQMYEPSEITVSDYLDFWFDNFCRMHLKYNSQVGYLQVIENHLRPTFGNYKLKALNAACIQEFANGLKLKGLARKSVLGIISTLSGALDYAVEPLHYLQYNPCDRIKYPRYEDKDSSGEVRYVISPESFKIITDRFPASTQFYIPLMIGYYTGLRISEAFALTWDDIDLEKNTLTVNKTVVKRNFGSDVRKVVEKKGKKELKSVWYFSTPKTPSSFRTVMFGETLRAALKEAKRQKTLSRLKYGEYYTEHYLKTEMDEKNEPMQRIIPAPRALQCALPKADMVCVRENGEYCSSDSFKYCARVIHNELRLGFNYHSLRHTHATYLIENGANPKDVQERLGHSSINTTLNVYVHNTDTLRKESVDIFERAALGE